MAYSWLKGSKIVILKVFVLVLILFNTTANISMAGESLSKNTDSELEYYIKKIQAKKMRKYLLYSPLEILSGIGIMEIGGWLEYSIDSQLSFLPEQLYIIGYCSILMGLADIFIGTAGDLQITRITNIRNEDKRRDEMYKYLKNEVKIIIELRKDISMVLAIFSIGSVFKIIDETATIGEGIAMGMFYGAVSAYFALSTSREEKWLEKVEQKKETNSSITIVPVISTNYNGVMLVKRF